MSAVHTLCWTGLRPDPVFHEASARKYLDHRQKERLHRNGIGSKSILIEMVYSEIEMKMEEEEKKQINQFNKKQSKCTVTHLNVQAER